MLLPDNIAFSRPTIKGKHGFSQRDTEILFISRKYLTFLGLSMYNEQKDVPEDVVNIKGGKPLGGPLALKLRLLRAERAWTIEEAAKHARVTPETISDAEHGKRRTYLPTLRKIAEGYGVPMEDLLRAEDESAAEPVGKGEALQDTGPVLKVESAESVITFSPGAVEEVVRAHKAGKISLKDTQRAIKDLMQGPDSEIERAIELMLSPASPHMSDAAQTLGSEAGATQR